MSFERERGFSVPELLIAVLLFVSLAVATLATLHGFVSALVVLLRWTADLAKR